MPSARKRRLRKIIKGYINRRGKDGELINTAESSKIADSSAINAADEAGLKTILGIGPDLTGKISYDSDADGAFGKSDPEPFNQQESKDTEGTGGDNQLMVDLYQQMTSLRTEISALASSTVVEKTNSDAAYVQASNNEAPGGNSELFCQAVADGESAVSAATANVTSASAKLDLVSSLETRITGLDRPWATDISIEGLNPDEIHQTDADALETVASSEASAVSSLNTEISANQSQIEALFSFEC